MNSYILTTSIPINVQVNKVNRNKVLFSIKLSEINDKELYLSHDFSLINYSMQYFVNDEKQFDNLPDALNYINSEFRRVILEQYAN